MFHFHFHGSTSSVTDWIQAICAIVVAILTIIIVKHGRRALNSWISQKNYDVYLEAATAYPNIKRDYWSSMMSFSIIMHELGDINIDSSGTAILPNEAGLEKLRGGLKDLENNLEAHSFFLIHEKLKHLQATDTKIKVLLEKYSFLGKSISTIRSSIFILENSDPKSLVSKNRLDKAIKLLKKNVDTVLMQVLEKSEH